MANKKRLIDANAYKASLAKWKEDAWKHNERHDAMLIADCLCELETMPTVDAVEVVHGRWIWTKEGEADWQQYWLCSECSDVTFFKTNYCSHCGAKMDGEAV